ncbi:hypothetical protein ACFYZJ_27565 [Streptomyces sp. NPDC001848]|uniref:hypothetical protein n=1 Tax=Streptomyces sp. NPDC001848 TaxID=3364618 RepID=UPI0036963E79
MTRTEVWLPVTAIRTRRPEGETDVTLPPGRTTDFSSDTTHNALRTITYRT